MSERREAASGKICERKDARAIGGADVGLAGVSSHLDDPVVEGVFVDLIRFLDGDVHQSHPRGTARRLVRQQRAGRVVTHLSPPVPIHDRHDPRVGTSQRQFAVVHGTLAPPTNRRNAVFRAFPELRRPVRRARVCRRASRERKSGYSPRPRCSPPFVKIPGLIYNSRINSRCVTCNRGGGVVIRL